MLVIIGIFFININAYSQSKTPYEKEIEDIHCTYFRALNIDESLILIAKKSGDWSITTKSREFSNAVHSMNKTLFLNLSHGFASRVKEASRLKTEVDVKREANKRAIKEKNEQISLVKKQEQENKQNLLKKEETQKLNLSYSDYTQIGNEIKRQFQEWAIKGEFEKTSEYEIRIANLSPKKFYDICLEKLNDITDEFLYENERQEFNNDWLKMTLGDYEADNEIYSVYFFRKKEYGQIDTLTGTIKLSPQKAQDFKDNFKDYKFFANKKDWIFSNYNFMPKKVTIKKFIVDSLRYSPEQHVIEFVTENEKQVTYSTADLGIYIPNLPQTSFDYTSQNHTIMDKKDGN